MKTLPPRSSLTNAVVASAGSRRSARAPRARGWRPPRRRCGAVGERHEHVHALGAAGLHRAGQAQRRRAPGARAGRRRPPRRTLALGRVEVEHEVRRPVPVVGRDQRRVVLDGPLVGEPQQRAPVVAERVGHLALGRLGPHRRWRPSPGVYFGTFFCMNGCCPGRPGSPTAGGRAARHDPVRDRVEVVDQVALGRAGAVEQGLVEIGQRHAARVSSLFWATCSTLADNAG